MCKWKRFFLIACSLFFLLFPLWLIYETNALFTDEVTVPDNIATTATLDIVVSPSPIFNVSNLVPGDRIERVITVQNVGTVPFTYFIRAYSNNTLLWTDVSSGLQLTITKGAETYFDGPISQINTNPNPDFLLNSGASDTLQFTILFPVTADNSFQNISETITFTFHAIQLPGTSR
ncbi:CalY family protein [Anoxybacillus kestanbolensis]|uniref:CalY family protein n=1 Tax=Anoxybacillus kestanbolensis TaxID=227476 RepID=UPI00208DB535|nr:CalY family protein [Anoxybacillus kestanbolensis]